MSKKGNIFRMPIRIRKNHIWISELLGLGIVVLVFVLLITMCWTAAINEITIQKYNTIIPLIKNERIVLSQSLDELRQKYIIITTLDGFTRNKLSNDIKWKLVQLVYTNSKTYGYDPLLVLAVIHVESLFDPKARGRYRDGEYSGAFGLMQLKTETAKEVADALGIPFRSRKDLFNPEINVPLGIAYLTQQISQFKSLKLGILAYNQGPGVIENMLKNKRPLSIRYYKKVLKSYYGLKKMSTAI